jgi:ankyrin repeat protein
VQVDYGLTVLHQATEHIKLTLVIKLIERGADTRRIFPRDKMTVLHRLVKNAERV